MTYETPMLPVADRWWRSSSISPRLTRIWEPHVTRLLRCNIWHVRGSHRDLLVDTGLGVAPLRSAFPDLFEREPIVVATHAHHDHVGGLHEFHERRGHRLESALVAEPPEGSLLAADLSSDEHRHLLEVGYEVPELFVDAVPDAHYDVRNYQAVAAPLTDVVDAGDVIDLGDVRLVVLHLPGHTPGSVGLFEEASGALFSGDAIYDGPLLDDLPESDPQDYMETMKALLELPINVVYAGHDQVFGRDRLTQLATQYIAGRASVPVSDDRRRRS